MALDQLRIASRRSQLAMVQTNWVKDELERAHPDLSISYGFVIVKLQNHAAKGITEKDFLLAREIERVIQWKPGKEGILDGTPEDPRFKYIKYD